MNALILNIFQMMFTGSELTVFAPYSIQGDIGGACGKFNNDSSDDKTTRPGYITDNVDKFLLTWTVS